MIQDTTKFDVWDLNADEHLGVLTLAEIRKMSRRNAQWLKKQDPAVGQSVAFDGARLSMSFERI